jgi:hypothetical protein
MPTENSKQFYNSNKKVMTIPKLIKKEKGLFRPCNWREICAKAVDQNLDESFFDRMDKYAHTADAFSKFNSLEEKKTVLAEWLAQISVENEFLAKEDPEYLQYRENRNVGNRSFSKLGRVVDFHVYSSIKARYQETNEPLKFEAIKEIWMKFAEQFKVLNIFHSLTFNSVFIDGQVSREQNRDSLFGTYLEYKKDNFPNGKPIKREPISPNTANKKVQNVPVKTTSSNSSNRNIFIYSSGTICEDVHSTCVAQRPQNNFQKRKISTDSAAQAELDALGVISMEIVNSVSMSTSLVAPDVSGGGVESETSSGQSSSNVVKKARRSSAEAEKKRKEPPPSDSSSTFSSSSTAISSKQKSAPPPKKVVRGRAAQIRINKQLQEGSSEVFGGVSSAASLIMSLFQSNG